MTHAQAMEEADVKSLAELLFVQQPTGIRLGNRINAGLRQGNTMMQEAAVAESVEPPKPPTGEFDMKELAGVTQPLGFWDPLGLSKKSSEGRQKFYRMAEEKHGRVAMLASLGILVGEHFHPMFGGNIDVPSYIAFQQTPLQSFWPAVAMAIAIPEIFLGLYSVEPEPVGVSARITSKFEEDTTVQTLSLTNRLWTMKADHKSGDWGFDPLGLAPNDAWIEKRALDWRDMQTKELNNGRLAMIAAAGMLAQEIATGKKLF